MSKGGIQFDPKAASQIIREEVERARQLIINHIRSNGQNASGRTIASHGSKLHRTGGRNDVYSNVVPDTMERLGQRLISLIHLSVGSIKLNNETI